MVDYIEKAIRKLGQKEQEALKRVLLQLKKGLLEGLDIKKLKGRDDIFRVRKGNMRILFQKTENSIVILSVERRSDTTY